MKDLISLGDYLSDLGYSPSCHQKVTELINDFDGSNYTIHTMVNPSEELEEIINQAIEQWNLNEFSFQDICGEDY